MNPARVSLAQVLDSGVPLTWNAAVAVAQAAAVLYDTNSLLNDAPSVVRSDTCFITTDGDIELPMTDPAATDDGVLMLLRQMLAGRDAPADLRLIATGGDRGDVTALLSRFEVGDGTALIAALAQATVASVAQQVGLPSERLLRKRSGAPEPAAQPEPERPLPPAPTTFAPPPVAASVSLQHGAPAADLAAHVDRLAVTLRRVTGDSPARARRGLTLAARHRTLVAGVAGALAMAGVWRVGAVVTRQWSGVPPLTVAEVAPAHTWSTGAGPWAFAAAVEPTRATADAVQRAAPRARMDEPTVPGAPSTSFAFAATPLFAVPDFPSFEPGAQPAPSAPGAAAAAPAAATAPSSAATDVDSAARRSTGNRGAPAAGLAASDDDGLFSADDGDVSPPILPDPMLPTSARAPGSPAPADWPYLVIVVGRAGTVEQVRLRASAPRPGESLYRHQMLLAAAKAWRFTPAMRNGRPVRYTIRVPLEP